MALVVITINAVNFVDGLDGLAAGMVCIAAAAFFMYAYRIWYSYGIEAAAPASLFAAILMGMCLGFLPHNMHPARIFMGDSGSMLIGLVLAAGAISVTGQVDPDAMRLFSGSERNTVHQMVPVYIPLLMPLTIIAIPAADLILAIVRRTWRGQSPFAAGPGAPAPPAAGDRPLAQPRGADHVLLLGADRVRRARLPVNAASMWIVLSVVFLSAIGLVLLLLPRFTPRAPRWAERFVPPRYRRAGPPAAAESEPAVVEDETDETDERVPVAAGASGVNGATAVGPRSRAR